jgi:hypothetical protein
MRISEELIQALSEEIDALKNLKGKNKGGNAVNIFNGRFLREISGLNVFVFNLENFLTALDDSPAEIDIAGYRYSAQILLTQGLEVEIGIERFSSNFIPQATLYSNSWYLLELLKKKMEESNGSTKVDFSISEAIFLGSLLKPANPEQIQINYSLGEKPPNIAQKKAIEASYSQSLSVVWGPPGTGKTRTVARAVESHLNAGRSVLFVSHANNAVDEALEDIADHLKGTPFYQEGELVRLGKPQEEHLKILETEYPLVLLDKIANKLGETLSKERSIMESEKTQIDDTISIMDKVLLALDRVKTLFSAIEDINSSLAQIALKLQNTQVSLSQMDDVQSRNRKRLLEAQSAGTLKRFMTGLHPDRIQREIDQTGIHRDSLARILEVNVELHRRIMESYQIKGIELSNAKAEADSSFQGIKMTESELRKRKSNYEIRRDVILSRISEINKELEEIQKNILADARLVATTLTKTYTARQFPIRKFDVLILDEASMAPLPHLYWALGLCRSFVTVIGDFLQLPPICTSESPMAQRWLARSIFDVLGIRSIEKAQNDERVTLLDTQYRMVPAISDISNRFIYQRILKDDSSTSRPSLNDGVSSSPLVLVETSNMNAWCSRISTGGRFNLYHALVCTTLAHKIINQLPECRIGIITPYSHQARLINKIAKDWQLSDKVRVSTIYRFQGGEEQIIIFDTTEGIGLKTAPMLDDQTHNSDALRVINVAMTRAKDKLYVVANSGRLLNELSPRSLLSRIIVQFQQNAQLLPSESLVDNYFVTDFEKWADALLATTNTVAEPVSGELYTERNFWAQFLHDVKMVEKRIIILSPFVSVRRSGMFMDLFKAMVARGIDVTVYSRPSNQQIGEMASQSEVVLSQLRSIGVNVTERRNMHQKVAVIDENIAWEGSLNILSHRDTGEQMRRFIGQSAIEELIRNLELSRNYAVGDQSQERCPGKDGKGCKHNGYLVVRQNRSKGNKFRGCSSYPKCKYTEPILQGRRIG